MSEYIVKYPLDLTGKAPENLVLGEPHVLDPGINRSAVPRYGAFYTDSLVVRDVDNGGQVLTPNEQYVPILYYAEASERSGKEVCAGIVVVDGTVSDNIAIDYQVVGGDFANITQVIIDLIENLELDNREVMWGDLLGRPDAFPPAQHLHDIGDLYGFEFVVEAMNAIREAILIGDVASHDEIKAMIEARHAQQAEAIALVDNEATTHANRTDNPHSVTKAQVGLGSVDNYPTATEQEAIDGVSNARFVTPSTMKAAVAAQAGSAVVEHANKTNNPHSVTKAQVGLGLVENFPVASEQEAIDGLRVDRYLTPALVHAAINAVAGDSLTQHVSNTNNPHSVTKAQVGLGNVPNYSQAGQVDAENGSSNTLFMTPIRTKEAIAKFAGQPLTSHVNNKANPHQVTKAQVGLGELPNAKTDLRTVNDTNVLLTAKGMFDHVGGFDHDGEYVKRAGDNDLGVMGFKGVQTAAGVFASGSVRNFAMYVHGTGTDAGGIAVRADDDNSDESAYAAINLNGERVFDVIATNGHVKSKTDFTVTSDARVKENVERLKDILPKLLGNGAYSYDRTDIDRHEIGVIAQEWQADFPELVHEDEEGKLSFSYARLSVLLLAALREMYGEQKELFARFNVLVSELLKSGALPEDAEV